MHLSCVFPICGSLVLIAVLSKARIAFFIIKFFFLLSSNRIEKLFMCTVVSVYKENKEKDNNNYNLMYTRRSINTRKNNTNREAMPTKYLYSYNSSFTSSPVSCN